MSPYEAATMSRRKGIPNRLGCFLTTWFNEFRRNGREEKMVICLNGGVELSGLRAESADEIPSTAR